MEVGGERGRWLVVENKNVSSRNKTHASPKDFRSHHTVVQEEAVGKLLEGWYLELNNKNIKLMSQNINKFRWHCLFNCHVAIGVSCIN